MENWGLIIYAQSQFLISPAMSTTADRRAAIITIAHEIAHQVVSLYILMVFHTEDYLKKVSFKTCPISLEMRKNNTLYAMLHGIWMPLCFNVEVVISACDK